ncbi:Protein D1 [Araneus ventricosus]|uniref:Protein D1 n=1 Tax=Araneus ventricosus TaxID=182803 RepID=A0A4Y2JIZ5_ARAVE|nr:Protein D1 [Araneus ventricosus]
MALELVYFIILISFSSISAQKNVCELSKFRTSNIVPIIISIVPEYALQVEFKNKSVRCGDTLNRLETRYQPTIINFKGEKNKFHTLVMIDPDMPSPQNPSLACYRHWLIENIPGDLVNFGDLVSWYEPPEPPIDSDPHRYIFLVYEQLTKLKDHLDNNQRTHFNLQKFTKDRGLQGPIAGNFFYLKY